MGTSCLVTPTIATQTHIARFPLPTRCPFTKPPMALCLATRLTPRRVRTGRLSSQLTPTSLAPLTAMHPSHLVLSLVERAANTTARATPLAAASQPWAAPTKRFKSATRHPFHLTPRSATHAATPSTPPPPKTPTPSTSPVPAPSKVSKYAPFPAATAPTRSAVSAAQ